MTSDATATRSTAAARFQALFAGRPAILAPMEDVTDHVFRALCRARGAQLCVTEFVNVEGLLRGCRKAAKKLQLAPEDQPTAIQIYGSDAGRLVEAARVAEASLPAYVDINCGCWVPKIARRGAGAGWLREPDAMVEMAAQIVKAISLPVTVKTRLGWGAESEMPIVDLARRFEDVGVSALTIHCRTAEMGHKGEADWSWARRAREVVSMPVIVNGDVNSAELAERALRETGCAGVMIGRRAIDHPWIFREVRALLDTGVALEPPTPAERLGLCREHLAVAVVERGETHGVRSTRRYLSGYLSGLPGAGALRRHLLYCDTLEGSLAILDAYEAGRLAPLPEGWLARPVDDGVTA